MSNKLTKWSRCASLSALVLIAPHIYAESTGAGNNGDLVEQLFEAGRTTALMIVERVIPCMTERSTNPMFVEELAVLPSTVNDLNTVSHVWNSQWPREYSQNVCSVTSSKKNAPIFLSWDHCRIDAADHVAAAKVLIINSLIHRGLSADEIKSRVRLIMSHAQNGDCGDFLEP